MKKNILAVISLYFTLSLFADNYTYLISEDAIYDSLCVQMKNNLELLSSGNKSFKPGDKILFKCGENFTGEFKPKTNSNGAENNPVTISSFSMSHRGDIITPGIGKKPVIDGSHKSGGYGTFNFINNDHFVIENICIKNIPGGDVKEAEKWKAAGITLQAYSDGISGFVIRNCEITDVNKGIYILNDKNDKNDPVGWKLNTIKDIKILNNNISNCGNIGIFALSASSNVDKSYNDIMKTYINYWFSDIIIKNNVIHSTKGNGIVLWGVKSPIVENNLVYNIAQGDNGQAIFVQYSENALIQNNEVFGVQYDLNDGDAGAIGIDFFSINTVCQYNYLHDNAQNGIAVMSNYSDAVNKSAQNPRPVKGSIIRYNVCVNNSSKPLVLSKAEEKDEVYKKWRSRCGEIRISGPADSCKIYNNVFISSADAYQIISETSWYGYPRNIYWANNIFYSENPNVKYSFLGKSNIFTNNCYLNKPVFVINDLYDSWTPDKSERNTLPENTNPVIADPLFNDVNLLLADRKYGFINWSDIGFEGLRLLPDSPCIGKGVIINITDPYFKGDFWGNHAYFNTPDIGANESNLDPKILKKY